MDKKTRRQMITITLMFVLGDLSFYLIEGRPMSFDFAFKVLLLNGYILGVTNSNWKVFNENN